MIERQDGETREVESEVVGFNGQRLFLMPLEEVEGILPGARVYAKTLAVTACKAANSCRSVRRCWAASDGSGKPLDGLPSLIPPKPAR